MWSLDGTLRYVPLTALYDGRQYLIGQYRLSVFTPASNARLKDRPDARWTGGGFGASKAHEGAAALPGAISELAGIIHQDDGAHGGVLDGDVRTDEAFTEQSMPEELRRRFTLAQIKNGPNLFGGLQILTLSACNTRASDSSGMAGKLKASACWRNGRGRKR
jgi:CHAT domain-containing protein